MGLRMSGAIKYSSKNPNMGPAFGPVVSKYAAPESQLEFLSRHF
jgi:hypothetical protein